MVNNTHACANSYTQNHLLKEEVRSHNSDHVTLRN